MIPDAPDLVLHPQMRVAVAVEPLIKEILSQAVSLTLRIAQDMAQDFATYFHV